MKAIVVVTNDLFSDKRVERLCDFLNNNGIEILLIGRKLKNSKSVKRDYYVKRFSLFFNRNFLFYAEYNIRLFFYLIFNRFDLIVSNDLDTLLPSYIVSAFKRKPLYYDTHEIFTEVPELKENHFARKFWLAIEKYIFPKLINVYTVNNNISDYYYNKYNVRAKVVMNISQELKNINFKSRDNIFLPNNKFIIIMQGAGINIDRGAEELVMSAKYLDDNFLILIIGSGDVFNSLKDIVIDNHLQEKVLIISKIPYNELIHYTYNSNLGVSLDKNTNLNYYYSLPNKIFDYINYGTPILCSNMKVISSIVEGQNIGWVIDVITAKNLAKKFIEIRKNYDEYSLKKDNLIKAKKTYNWENEEIKLKEIYKRFINS